MTIEQLIDPQGTLTQRHFAVVFTPRRKRNRFPENCVQLYDSLQQAEAEADPDNNRFAAQVYGPARSSEGFRLYYLIEWL